MDTVRALILSCERVQTHSRVPINDSEGFQGTPVPHRGGTGGASLTTGVGHARPTQQIRQITLLRKCGHAKASILSCGPESSGALLSGRVSSRTVPRQAHTAHMTSCQRPVTHMVAARAQWSTCSSPQAGRAMRRHRRHTPVDRNRMRARCSLPTPPPASGAALPAVTEGGAAEAADKAAAEPPSELRAGRAEALSTDGRAGGPHRPTRFQRLADLESRALSGRKCSSCQCGGAEPPEASPRDRLAHRSAPAEGKESAHVSV
jgi:hypothetical protein